MCLIVPIWLFYVAFDIQHLTSFSLQFVLFTSVTVKMAQSDDVVVNLDFMREFIERSGGAITLEGANLDLFLAFVLHPFQNSGSSEDRAKALEKSQKMLKRKSVLLRFLNCFDS